LISRTLLHLKLVTITYESYSDQVFHSFYKEIQSEFLISVKDKNLFLSLAESITQTLNVTSCYVCGGMNMGDHWPWEARELNPQKPFNETTLRSYGKKHLATKNLCYQELLYLPSKRPILHLVGDLICLGHKFYNDTAQETQWCRAPNHTEPHPHSPVNFPKLAIAWNNLTAGIE
jgi:hypothetical protein